MAEYDKIAKGYSQAGDTNANKIYVVLPSVLKCLGDIGGVDILDLACGDGFLSRELISHGAKSVVGVDLSVEMIRIALEKERDAPLGIKYFAGDVISLDKIGEFKIITGEFLLHYSKSKEELDSMCKNIYDNLQEGGRFVGVNANPEHPLANGKKYGTTATYDGDLHEGAPIEITIYDGDEELCSFINYHWSKKTYEDAFRKSGFSKVLWSSLKVSDEGIEKYGSDFWKEGVRDDNLTLIEAIK